MNETNLNHIKIERPFYEHKQLREDFCYHKPKKTSAAKEWTKNFRLKKALLQTIPVLDWLSKYDWKTDLIKDVIAGVTVGIMQIPQGMAYVMLASLPSIIGLYTAFFPVLIYFIFGTSRHNSMGAFSVLCLLTGKAVVEHSDPLYFIINEGGNVTGLEPTGYSPTEVAVALNFLSGIFQLAMYTLRLGAVSALLSNTMVSGFTTGAAVQILIMQGKDLLGLNVPKYKGNFANIYTVIKIFQEISNTNIAALIVSFVTITISAVYNDYLKPQFAKISPFPFPMELVAVVAGTLVSRFFYLNEDYGVKVVGNIPLGIPSPSVPSFELMSSLIMDGITTAVVAYTVSMSMALIFANKLDYEVDANQELLALSLSNIFSSFFSCISICASLSRSLIQQTVGGVTQMASLVSCVLLLVILLWVGPFFEPLPKAVLASVIVVALKGIVLQFRDFWKFWKLSKMDAVVWMGTFLTVVFVAIDIGLICGVALSLISIFLLSVRPHTCLLGQVNNTDFYLDISRYQSAKEIEGIKIFHYAGGINFATKSVFRSDLIRLLGLNPQKEVVYRAKLAKYLGKADKQADISNSLSTKLERVQRKINTDLRCLILDFSSVSHIDPSGVTMVKSITESFAKLDIPVYLACCKEPVYEMLTKVYPDDSPKTAFRSFPSVHDAVFYAKELFQSSTNSTISTIKL